MATAHDIAAYILKRRGEMSAMKLEKLLYYSQAWTLVWLEHPLFPEKIEAWANGPVVRKIYALHRKEFSVSTWPSGDAESLDSGERRSVDSVLSFYGDRSAQYLSDLTHMEDPWKRARAEAGAGSGVQCQAEITCASMAEYYGGLLRATGSGS